MNYADVPGEEREKYRQFVFRCGVMNDYQCTVSREKIMVTLAFMVCQSYSNGLLCNFVRQFVHLVSQETIISFRKTEHCFPIQDQNFFFQICNMNLNSVDRWVTHTQSKKHFKVQYYYMFPLYHFFYLNSWYNIDGYNLKLLWLTLSVSSVEIYILPD